MSGTDTTTHPMLDEMLGGYIAVALWSSTDEIDPETGGDPMDANYGPDDIHPDTLASMTAACELFLLSNDHYIADGPGDASQAGRDFWLTRCGHGTGFWDRGDDVWHPVARDAMDAYSRDAGNVDLYVGDDGMIHQM